MDSLLLTEKSGAQIKMMVNLQTVKLSQIDIKKLAQCHNQNTVMLEFKITHKCCPKNFFFFADNITDIKSLCICFFITALTNSPKWNDLNLSHSSVVQKSCGLDWFVCLKSHKTSIKVLAGLCSFLEALVNKSFLGLFKWLVKFISMCLQD